MALYDKMGEITPEFLAEVPCEKSFCQFVIRDGLFRTADSAMDSRLDGLLGTTDGKRYTVGQ